MATPNLFEPYLLNDKLPLKNRLVMAPMTTWSGLADGKLSPQEIAYYRAQSAGLAMVITATTYMTAHGKGFTGQFYAGDDAMLDSLEQLANAIHSRGARAILQVFHAGRKANPLDMPDGKTRSASPIAAKRQSDNIPQALNDSEIEQIIDSFGQVVHRAARAGFDGIEIHGANTYLLQQFFSPHSNQRSDQWGGNLVKRMQFPLAIVRSCLDARQALSKHPFIIGYRFSPEENSQPGITMQDTEQLIEALCATELDYLHVSLSDYRQTSLREESAEPTILQRVIKAIDQRKPLIAVGQIRNIDDARDLLASGADLVALGRQLLIDSATAQKWQRAQPAKQFYQRRRPANIPLQLHRQLLARDGWMPLK